MTHGLCELLWIQRILRDLGIESVGPMKLFCDNKYAIIITQNSVQHDRIKHVEVDVISLEKNLIGRLSSFHM